MLEDNCMCVVGSVVSAACAVWRIVQIVQCPWFHV